MKKLTEGDVLVICDLLEGKFTYREIAKIVHLDSADIKILEILLIPNHKHIAKIFNKIQIGYK